MSLSYHLATWYDITDMSIKLLITNHSKCIYKCVASYLGVC